MIWATYEFLGRFVRVFERLRWSAKTKRPVPGHTLYHFYVSPYAMKARNAACALGLDIPLKDILSDSQAAQELVSQGGRDQVPCLRIESGGKTSWMYESSDIIDYLKGLKGHP